MVRSKKIQSLCKRVFGRCLGVCTCNTKDAKHCWKTNRGRRYKHLSNVCSCACHDMKKLMKLLRNKRF